MIVRVAIRHSHIFSSSQDRGGLGGFTADERGGGWMQRVVPPDAGGAGEARGGRVRKWPPSGTVAGGDWAEMRVLQWFRGERSQKRCC